MKIHSNASVLLAGISCDLESAFPAIFQHCAKAAFTFNLQSKLASATKKAAEAALDF